MILPTIAYITTERFLDIKRISGHVYRVDFSLGNKEMGDVDLCQKLIHTLWSYSEGCVLALLTMVEINGTSSAPVKSKLLRDMGSFHLSKEHRGPPRKACERTDEAAVLALILWHDCGILQAQVQTSRGKGCLFISQKNTKGH